MDERPDGDTAQGHAADTSATGGQVDPRRAGGRGPAGALRRLPGLVAGLARGPLSLGLPVSCAGCGRWETALCPRCRGLLEAGALPVEHAEAAGGLEILAAAVYAGPVRSLVLGWKRGAREDLDEVMSEVGRGLGRAWASHLASRLASHPASHPDPLLAEGWLAGPHALPTGSGAVGSGAARGSTADTADTADDADDAAGEDGAAAPSALLVVPAPSGAGRRLRGRLVAARLADAVARGIADHGVLGGGTVHRVLSADVLRRRGGAGAHQAGLSAYQRRANRATAPRVLAEVRGLPVVLVDDVVTTGATLGSCVRALEEAGAHVLGAAVLAATPPPGGARRADSGLRGYPPQVRAQDRAGDDRHVRHRRSDP